MQKLISEYNLFAKFLLLSLICLYQLINHGFTKKKTMIQLRESFLYYEWLGRDISK